MSITHSESGQPDSINTSGGSKELTDQYKGNCQLDGAVDELRPIISHMTISSKNLANAEKAARRIIQKVRPTSESEKTRREVIGYIQRLIRSCLGIEVLPYGSVPLRTYLPDGDIDLTAFGGASVEEYLVDDMKFVLEREEKNRVSEFAVKDVQIIRAEVKLVKCIVQNIVVDVSFNQIGGLSTLCFLEQIDCLIGRDHLFKNSIILIKAWCYYESRILGAHHGLISTYALETLVLYIFHLYHSTLDGPLSVLYKFLDYFSKFDWETYCISLNGPVRLSSLPDVVVERPKDSDGNLLLSSDFLSSCVDMFSVPSRVVDHNSRGFQLKHLNIVDPLKETNNLGRSVSKGNFYRVRSAFTYGAKKLARILSQAENTIADELPKFFPNTMARHGSNQGTNIHDLDTSISGNGSISMPPASDSCVKGENSMCENCDEVAHSTVLSKEYHEPISPSHRCTGDANELATLSPESLRIPCESSKSQNEGQTEMFKPIGQLYCAPHQFFAESESRKASSVKNGDPDSDKMETRSESPEKNERIEKEASVGPSSSSFSNHARVSSTCSEVPESLNSLTDLTGDYDSYFQCLQYGRWCYEYSSGLPSLHIPSSPNATYHNVPWDGTLPPPFKRNGFSNQHRNGFHQSPIYAAMPHMIMPGAAFGWEEIPKPRGTGTYFPNMNQMPQGYMPSSRPPFNNGRNMNYQVSSMENGGQEPPPQSQIPASFDDYQTFSPPGNEYLSTPNGLIAQPEAVVEVGSASPAPGTSISETSKHQESVDSSPRTLRQKSPPAYSKEQDRISPRSSYHLKDQDDFPPL